MIAALVLLAYSGQAKPITITLSQGEVVSAPGGAFRYWAASDTYLNSQSPDQGFGGEGVLEGGPGRTILIQFGDLERVIAGPSKILDATLYLTPSGGEKPSLHEARRILAPWSEGPGNTMNAMTALEGASRANGGLSQPVVKPGQAAPWSASWRLRRSGELGLPWQSPGAVGSSDSESITGARVVSGDREVAITGLAPAVQRMADGWYDNHGIALSFENPVEFFSCKAAMSRPRLVLLVQPVPLATGPDLSVTQIDQSTESGGEVTYTAHIKNVGNAASEPFQAEWTVGERPGSRFQMPDKLAPGVETTITTHQPFRFNASDHRVQPIQLQIFPSGPDASTQNDALQIQGSALAVTIAFDSDKIGKVANFAGSRSFEDWAQAQARIFNDVYSDQSRFSFAPEGSKERIALRFTPTAPSSVNITLSSIGNPMGADTGFLRSIGLAAGIPDLASSSIPAGQRNTLANRGGVDPYAGVMGYGDTRNESLLPGQISLPAIPAYSPIFNLRPLEQTDMLSATDVAALNAGLSRTTSTSDVLARAPRAVLIRALDLTGHPLDNTILTFYQLKGAKIGPDSPTFTVTTGKGGQAILPHREDGGAFGRLAIDGSNGAFLIKATQSGVTEWSWLKAWELIDAYDRGNVAAGLLEVRFDLGGSPLATGTNLASDKLVSDSANSLPAKLTALNDGNDATDAVLPGKPGDWVEIDLGRDRTVGEIDLVGKPDQMWQQFDILVYATGQQLQDAVTWAKEIDWRWSAQNRCDPSPGGSSVAYRFQPQRIRFVRIVNRSGAPGRLGEIRVVPVANPG